MPSASRPTSLETPRGLFEFNAGGSTYARLDPDGFTLNAAVRSGVEALPQRHGSIVPPSFRGGATPILKGVVTIGGGEDARDAMIEDLIAHALSILGEDGILRWEGRDGVTRRMVVRCLEDPQEARGGVLAGFQIALVSTAAYPESDTLKTAVTAAMAAGGGESLVFPIEFPIEFGSAGAGGSATIENDGNATSYGVARIYGPIGGPTLRLVETGETISLPGLSLIAGDYAEIDMQGETVLFNGSPEFSLIGNLDPLSSDFFGFPEGDSTVILSGSGTDSSTRAEIDYRDTLSR